MLVISDILISAHLSLIGFAMSHRKREDISKGDESPEENSKDKHPTRISGKRSRSYTDDHGNGRAPELKKAAREGASDEAIEGKKIKSPSKRRSKRSRSSTSDSGRRSEQTYDGGSGEETKKIKSPTSLRKLSKRLRSSTSDDGRAPDKTRGGSNESPVEKRPPGRKRRHSDSDGQEDEKMVPKKKVHVVHESASSKSRGNVNPMDSGKVKLQPGMLGRRKRSETDDQGEGWTGERKTRVSTSRDDETLERLTTTITTPGEKKLPTRMPGKRSHSSSDDRGNGRPPDKRTHEGSRRDDETPEHLSTPVESTGNKVTKPPPKMGKRSQSSTESQEDGRPLEKRAKPAPTMTKVVVASSSKRRDSKPNESAGKGITESGSRSGNKKRAKSPEIFAHNLKVLRKKSAMRRKKLTKEVKVVEITCMCCTELCRYDMKVFPFIFSLAQMTCPWCCAVGGREMRFDDSSTRLTQTSTGSHVCYCSYPTVVSPSPKNKVKGGRTLQLLLGFNVYLYRDILHIQCHPVPAPVVTNTSLVPFG